MGCVIEPKAFWAKDQIFQFYENKKLSGNDLNKSFHKSWQKIISSTREELLFEQISHYISTYGSGFKDEIYIPNEVLNLPETIELRFKVIKSYSRQQLIDKCFDLLKSGIALNESTINEILSLLVDKLNYQFTGSENVKNKEAIIKIADIYGVTPQNTIEFFRYIIYRTTGQSLLIKNNAIINEIRDSNYNPAPAFNQFGLEKLSTIFNRFKPLFLAFKGKCPKTINKIAKLSKKHHLPLISNPLNDVTHRKLISSDIHWLDNATTYALFKAISLLWSRLNGHDSFVYRIRNGKSWTKLSTVVDSDQKIIGYNLNLILSYLKKRIKLSNKSIFLPKDIEFSLPTSEKMFVGNIPTGTKFYASQMAVGVYWMNGWGAHDLDLSGLNIGGKIGWNTQYNQNDQLLYSGDMTIAPNGAVEYLHALHGLNSPTLILNNVYSGNYDCGYKIVIGEGHDLSRNFMMNPENIKFEQRCKSVQKQTILGIMIPEKTRQSFVVLNFGSSNARVSGNSKLTDVATKALYQQWANPYKLRDMLVHLNANIVDNPKDADFDLSIDGLQKNTFVDLFK